MSKPIERLPVAPPTPAKPGEDAGGDAPDGNGSTGDQIGGQSEYAEDETDGKQKGLPRS
jgi:hypothetical protein